MRLRTILGIVGVLLLLASTTFLCGAIVAFIYKEFTLFTFLGCFVLAVVLGLPLMLFAKRDQHLRSRDAFLVVGVCYVILGLVCSIPFALASGITASFADAVFESVSGLTTTGATVLQGIDFMPYSLLLYRQMLQWVGGMGIIVLAVAILPFIGVGGVQLYKAEAPGSERELPLQLRVQETATTLWAIYLGLTVACCLGYWIGGMTFFDALCHAFSTVAIGGFSTHDTSFAYFNSGVIETIAIVFMVLAGVNFMIHYMAFFGLRRHKLLDMPKHILKSYLGDSEVRLYLLLLGLIATVVTVRLCSMEGFTLENVRATIFQSVSFATTTGFTSANYEAWPLICPVLLLFASFAGGCTGSTAGGIKVYRVLLLARQGVREIRRLIHPGGIFNLSIDGRRVPERVLETAWGFLAVYAASFIVLFCAMLMMGGLDFKSAFAAVAACLNNLGPGLGDVADGFHSVSDGQKWLMMFAMILGRLEVFTVLVLFAPSYWRK